MQDALNVAPIADIKLGGFAEGILDPLKRVRFLGLDETVADERGDRANVLFVQAEDAGPLLGFDRRDDGFRLQLQFASTGADDCLAGSRVVDEVEPLRAGRAVQANAQQRASVAALFEAAGEAFAPAADVVEGLARPWEHPDLVRGGETGFAALLLDNLGDQKKGEKRAG